MTQTARLPEAEVTPADVDAVGAEDLGDEGAGGFGEPGAQGEAEGGGKQALPGGLVEEGAADEGSGCAEEFGDFDFFFAGEDLQSDSVVGDEDEGDAEGDGEEGEDAAHEGVDAVEGLQPFGVEFGGFHHRQGGEVLAQGLGLFGG